MTDDSSKEREILMVMRKLLAQIIKDTTPPSRAMKHPLALPSAGGAPRKRSDARASA